MLPDPPLSRFYRLCFHYINCVFSVKTHHEEVDVVFAITRHGPKPSFNLGKFFDFTITVPRMSLHSTDNISAEGSEQARTKPATTSHME
jgi:hypothetical protein